MRPVTRWTRCATTPGAMRLFITNIFLRRVFASSFVSRRYANGVKDVYFERGFAGFLTFQRSSAWFSLSLHLPLPLLLSVVTRVDKGGSLVSSTRGKTEEASRYSRYAVRRFALSEFLRSFIYTSVLRSPWFPFRRGPSSTLTIPSSRHRFSFLYPVRASDEPRSSSLYSPPRVRNAFVFADYLGDSVLSAIAISSQGCFFPLPAPFRCRHRALADFVAPPNPRKSHVDWRIFCVNASGRNCRIGLSLYPL